jgi:hypothetical protein
MVKHLHSVFNLQEQTRELAIKEFSRYKAKGFLFAMDGNPLHHNREIERDKRGSRSSLFLTGNPAAGVRPTLPCNLHARSVLYLVDGRIDTY